MENNSFEYDVALAQDSLLPFISKPIMVFEIPLILDAICKDLKIRDFGLCRAVCKTWLSLFDPFFWRKIDWVLATKNISSDIISSHSHFIKDLILAPCHTSLVGDSGLINLLTLDIKHYLAPALPRDSYYRPYDGDRDSQSILVLDADGFLKPRRSENWNCECSNRSISTLNLVKQNPRLKHLSFDITNWTFKLIFGNLDSLNYNKLGQEDDGSILWALKNHPALESLEIKYYFLEKPSALTAILRHCPEVTLQRLVLRSPRSYKVPPELASTIIDYLRDPIVYTDDSWPMFPAMKSIEIFSYINNTTAQTLAQFLRRCPNLTCIRLPPSYMGKFSSLSEALRNYCPKIEELYIPTRASRYMDLPNLFESKPNLKVVHLDQCRVRNNAIIPSILQTSSSTIKDISLFKIDIVSSNNIARVLAECPNLEIISITGLFRHGGSISFTDLVTTPWASNKIKLMELDVSLAAGKTILTRQGIVDLLVDFIFKVEQLNNPEIHIKWASPLFIMSLEQGLALSKGKITETQLNNIGLAWRPELTERDARLNLLNTHK